MSNKREIEPSLDFYELRRRHEEYKNSQKQKAQPEAAENSDATVGPEVPGGAREPRRVAPAGGEVAVEETPVAGSEWAPAAGQTEDGASGAEALDLSDVPEDQARLDEGDDDALPEGDAASEDDDAGADNPNPFDSFIHAFHGIRGKLSGRFGRRRGGDEEDYEDEDEDEDAAPLEDTVGEQPHPTVDLNDGGDAAPGDDLPAGAEDDAPVEDVLEDAPKRRAPRHDGAEVGELQDVDPDDEDEDEYEDVDEPRELSGFQRFLRLFVVPIDEDESDDEYGDEDEDDDSEALDSGADGEPTVVEDDGQDLRGDESAWAAPAGEVDGNEGGPDMSDLNNVNSELTNALAAELEGSGMSRRERRELALRQAAEKAAAEAARVEAEAAAQQAAEAVAQEAEEVVQATAQQAEETLEADDIQDVAKGIVEMEQPAKGDYDGIMDEPTKEFKPVSKASLDDLMNEDDDEDEDDEEEERPRRRGLFGRRRRDRDDDEDEDDYDDEDDEDEDDEEEERPRRRGLFGRRRRAEDEDEDEDDDDYDDDEDEEEDDRPRKKSRRGRHYDEDDDDDYDDYDDDDDDYDDYDDDDEGTSFGHVLLGILKGFLTAVMLLLFVVVILNVLNIFNVISLEGFAKRLPTRMASVFLPSEGMKQRMNVEAGANPAPVTEGEPLVPQPTAVTPVEEAPEVEAPAEEETTWEEPAEEAPAEETPVEEEPAEEAGEAVG